MELKAKWFYKVSHYCHMYPSKYSNSNRYAHYQFWRRHLQKSYDSLC